MRNVFKYKIPVEDEFELKLPMLAKILTIQTQHGMPNIWVLVDTDNPMETRKFKTFGTGHTIPDEKLDYVATYLIENDALVFHVFEVM